MSEGQRVDTGEAVRSAREVAPVSLDWGELVWLVGNEQMPGARQTFGVVTIHPGKRNPLHRHPNCEELLYVLEGEADHRLGDEMYHLRPGDVIRIPQGVPHWARATSDSPVVAIISFSSGDRQTENLDSGDGIA
jgi:quercetin dioxygenase-like cupin family protein